MPNQVQVDFVGNAKPLYSTADATPAKLAQSGDAAGKAYATAFAKQTAAIQNSQPGREQFFREQQLAAAKSFAVTDKAERAATAERFKDFLTQYRVKNKAEEKLEEETAGKIKQIRGFGAFFRLAGLTSIGIDESSINVAIELYNTYKESAAEAAKVAQTTAAVAETAAAAESVAVASTATTAEAAAAAGALAAVAAETSAAATEEAAAAAIAAEVAATGVGAGFVVVTASIVAAGAAALLAIASYRKESDQKLIGEERVTTELEKQATHIRRQVEDYERFKQLSGDKTNVGAEIERLTKDKNTQEIKRLQSDLDVKNTSRAAEIGRLENTVTDFERAVKQDEKEPGILGTIFGRGPLQRFRQTQIDTKTLDTAKRDLEILKEQQSQGQSQFSDYSNSLRQITKDQNKEFSDGFKTNVENRKKESELDEKQFKERQDNIEKAKKQAHEIADTILSVQSKFKDNPFVKILTDEAKALEDLSFKLKDATPELLKFAQAQVKAGAANALFSARIDNAVGVSDLRQQASFFRNGQKGEKNEDFLRRLGFNPQQFKDLSEEQLTRLLPQLASRKGSQDAQSISDAERLSSRNVLTKAGFGRFADFENSRILSGTSSVDRRFNGVNVADLALGAFQNAQQRKSDEETPQQRLDRQIKELDKLRPENAEQRLAQERKIQSLSSGVDPTTLRQDTRNRVADALNDLADNAAKAQGDATKALEDNTAMLKTLNETLQGKTGGTDSIAPTGKAESQQVNITFFDESNGKASVDVKAPTPRDTSIGFGQ